MADQRRRGRGRSGRGGRIPRKGEQQATNSAPSEPFVSFPVEGGVPIIVAPVLDEAAIMAAFRDTAERETRQQGVLRALVTRTGDPSLTAVQEQADKHRDVLAQLARELGVDVPRPGEVGSAEGASAWDLVAEHALARLGWSLLQRVAYASGDRRIDRAVKPVLREKQRHAEVLEAYAVTAAASRLFLEPAD